jgi:hypothetical protein
MLVLISLHFRVTFDKLSPSGEHSSGLKLCSADAIPEPKSLFMAPDHASSSPLLETKWH